jgi:hypothetical protein
MLDLRKRIFILVGIVAGIILAILLVIFVLYKTDKPQTEEPLDVAGDVLGDFDFVVDDNAIVPASTPTITTPAAPDQGAEERFVRHLARTFVERFGSYSNQNDNKHVEEALSLSSNSMQAWINSQSVEQAGEYVGVTTQVIQSDVISFDNNSAVVHVGVQEVVLLQVEEQRNYKNARVELVKIADEWKINSLYWEE